MSRHLYPRRRWQRACRLSERGGPGRTLVLRQRRTIRFRARRKPRTGWCLRNRSGFLPTPSFDLPRGRLSTPAFSYRPPPSQSTSNAIDLWVPSQNGLFADPPHRQGAPETPSALVPAAPRISTGPRTRIGPCGAGETSNESGSPPACGLRRLSTIVPASVNPASRCESSQNGLSFECPQRQRAARVSSSDSQVARDVERAVGLDAHCIRRRRLLLFPVSPPVVQRAGRTVLDRPDEIRRHRPTRVDPGPTARLERVGQTMQALLRVDAALDVVCDDQLFGFVRADRSRHVRALFRQDAVHSSPKLENASSRSFPNIVVHAIRRMSLLALKGLPSPHFVAPAHGPRVVFSSLPPTTG